VGHNAYVPKSIMKMKMMIMMTMMKTEELGEKPVPVPHCPTQTFT
jgi:hypothetical protein